MSEWGYFAFLLCVALACFTQNLTGFAFGLILLSLVTLLQLAPLADAANVVSILVLVNAAMLLRGQREYVVWSLLWPTLLMSLVGVVAGLALLAHLSVAANTLLRALLGGVILVCSLLLILQKRPLAAVSGRLAFAYYGSLSGVLGGLFSSAGPPMVYLLYRQPLPLIAIRNTLTLLFAANAVLRLGILVSQHQFTALSWQLAAGAVPVVLILTWLQRKYPPKWPALVVRRVVFVLLLLAGLGLLLPVLSH
jgi:uncharacterized membrane protein YfcA